MFLRCLLNALLKRVSQIPVLCDKVLSHLCRFSHGTMPLTNLFKNCGYYWGFAAFVSYFVNHPQYTAPSTQAAKILLGVAVLCQFANLT